MFYFALKYNLDHVTHHVTEKIGDTAANFFYIDNSTTEFPTFVLIIFFWSTTDDHSKREVIYLDI